MAASGSCLLPCTLHCRRSAAPVAPLGDSASFLMPVSSASLLLGCPRPTAAEGSGGFVAVCPMHEPSSPAHSDQAASTVRDDSPVSTPPCVRPSASALRLEAVITPDAHFVGAHPEAVSPSRASCAPQHVPWSLGTTAVLDSRSADQLPAAATPTAALPRPKPVAKGDRAGIAGGGGGGSRSGKSSSSSRRDKDGLRRLAEELTTAVNEGRAVLRLAEDGVGGTYFVHLPASGAVPYAVFKPSAEENGASENPRGNTNPDDDDRYVSGAYVPGEGHLREVLAYQLDHEGFAGVPETVAASLHGQPGSLQRFIPGMIQSWSTTPGQFDRHSVQAIAALDLRLLNSDRHGGNLLLRRDAPGLALVPIDHGLVLPHVWCDPDFEWALWPQSAAPVTAAVRDYVARLNAAKDEALVAKVLGPEAGELVGVTTRMLQLALRPGTNYTLRDVAEFCRRSSPTQPCGLETLLHRCRRDLEDGGDLDPESVDKELLHAFPADVVAPSSSSSSSS